MNVFQYDHNGINYGLPLWQDDINVNGIIVRYLKSPLSLFVDSKILKIDYLVRPIRITSMMLLICGGTLERFIKYDEVDGHCELVIEFKDEVGFLEIILQTCYLFSENYSEWLCSFL